MSLRALFLLTTVAACSSTTAGPPSGTAPASTTAGNSGTSVTTVTATEGGKITASDGLATLAVPKGAVSNDVDVKVSVSAGQADTAGSVYKFEPAGTTFAVPAAISVSTTGIKVPDGKTLTLAEYRDTKWQSVLGAKLVSGSVEASMSKLGTVALVFTEAPATSRCDTACMAQSGAVCCDTCGCKGEVQCQPTCKERYKWDCEMTCCFDYTTLKCQ